jgi:hypothetical protein
MIASQLISQEAHRFGIAWVCLCVALALHVADEAATDFLSVYNPTVLAMRKRFPFLPLPVFTFRVWLTGLCLAILLAFSLSPMAFQGRPFMIWLAYPFALLMFGNGLGHVGASLYRRRLMPGLYSSPFLLLASAYLLICAESFRHTPPATGESRPPTSSTPSLLRPPSSISPLCRPSQTLFVSPRPPPLPLRAPRILFPFPDLRVCLFE